mgnify:CR=1 FL=1
MKLNSVRSTALGGMLVLVSKSVRIMTADWVYPTVVELFHKQKGSLSL